MPPGAVLVLCAWVLASATACAEQLLLLPTAAGPVTVRLVAAAGAAPRPAVLILHGRDGLKPQEVYRRYAEALAAAGIDAWLFSYYSPEDDEIMRKPGREQHIARFGTRIPPWARMVSELADAALARAESSGQVGLLGLSNGGFLAVGAAAVNAHIGALVVLYGGIPGPMRDEIARLPPLLAMHGEADHVIPVAEGQALVDRARQLGGQAELIVYRGAGHGFDFDPHSASAADARLRAVAFLRRHLGAL